MIGWVITLLILLWPQVQAAQQEVLYGLNPDVYVSEVHEARGNFPSDRRDGTPAPHAGRLQDSSGGTHSISRVAAHLTFYYCLPSPGYPLGDSGGWCGTMANGEEVHDGALACGRGLAMGSKLYLASGEYLGECKDTGYLHRYQVDKFFRHSAAGWDWLASLPATTMVVEIR